MDFQAITLKLKNEIIDRPYGAFATFLLMTILIVAVATFLSYFTLLPFVYDSNQNSTSLNMTSFVNQNSSDFVSIFVNTMLTLGLILFSALSLSSAQDALKQSEKQQKQFQDEQRIRDIEKRLEFFYIPADDIINNDRINKKPRDLINGVSAANYDGLKKIRKYSYLADKATYEAYETYIKSNCTKLKSVTCEDKSEKGYKGINNCEHETNCSKIPSLCQYNLNYCEHYNECPPKDNLNIIIDNTKCKYYIELKDKITTDIENYKNELLKLKG